VLPAVRDAKDGRYTVEEMAQEKIRSLAVEAAVNHTDPAIVSANLAVAVVAVPVVAIVREAKRVVIDSARNNLNGRAQKRLSKDVEISGRVDFCVGTDLDRGICGVVDCDGDLVVVLGGVLLLMLYDVDAAESVQKVSVSR
jgi:hypothetical protein